MRSIKSVNFPLLQELFLLVHFLGLNHSSLQMFCHFVLLSHRGLMAAVRMTVMEAAELEAAAAAAAAVSDADSRPSSAVNEDPSSDGVATAAADGGGGGGAGGERSWMTLLFAG